MAPIKPGKYGFDNNERDCFDDYTGGAKAPATPAGGAKADEMSFDYPMNYPQGADEEVVGGIWDKDFSLRRKNQDRLEEKQKKGR
jgi:hypothetical protein